MTPLASDEILAFTDRQLADAYRHTQKKRGKLVLDGEWTHERGVEITGLLHLLEVEMCRRFLEKDRLAG